MRNIELDRLLEKAVADALGVASSPMATLHRRASAKPHRAYPRKAVHSAQVISARYRRVASQAHA